MEGRREEEPILEDEWRGAVGPGPPSALLAPEVVVIPLPAQLGCGSVGVQLLVEYRCLF